MDAPWTKTPKEVFEHFGIDPNRGLTADQAAKHAELYGKNGAFSIPEGVTRFAHARAELPEDPPTPLLELILEQFKDQLVLILLASAVISFVLALFEEDNDSGFMGAFVEPLVILLILVANATVGVIQETNAERAIDVRVFSARGECVLTPSTGAEGILT